MLSVPIQCLRERQTIDNTGGDENFHLRKFNRIYFFNRLIIAIHLSIAKLQQCLNWNGTFQLRSTLFLDTCVPALYTYIYLTIILINIYTYI